MATERQVEANRRNSMHSTGPKSADGKARSRVNATKHGLAGESAEVESELSPEFEQRRARWAAEQQPVGESALWALDRAVAASLRIERCERAVDQVLESTRRRAILAWDEDRAIEAATLATRLPRNPVLVSRKLQASLAGVSLLIEAWLGLLATLEAGTDWSELEVSKALDLLGVAPDARSARTPIDPPEGTDPVRFHIRLALEEMDRLEEFRDVALVPLDEEEQTQAMKGDIALLSKPAKLLLRYERDAWKHYRESMKEVQAPASPTAEISAAPEIPAPTKNQDRSPCPAPNATRVGSRMPSSATLSPLGTFDDGLEAFDFLDEDASPDEIERRPGMSKGTHPLSTERSQFVAVPA